MQKSNPEAEVYNNNEKCDWKKEENQNKTQSLIRIHSVNKIKNYNGGGEGKEEKNP